MTTPKIKLTYFNLPGSRTEPSRVALHIANIPFEDHRVTNEEWAALKPKAPLGQVPILEVDGKVMCQSNAIMRYIGKLTKLYPTDDWQAAKVDEIMDTIEDWINTLMPSVRIQDLDQKKAVREELCAPGGALVSILEKLDKLLSDNKTGKFCVGDEVTMADLKLTYNSKMISFGFFHFLPENITDNYPRIKEIIDNTLAIPAVAEWEQKRGVVIPPFKL
eukprot:TRINITY_DN9958_c0_g1_i1.p1 TRINITY_DN9958_c0_g1~~TRINITY_DN9958_c0_g1_i1.p1  ORF type:complete len:219 (+),score=60.03 TRINITY_DN9958_c0_g1_i1:116-772(+)